MGFFFGSNAKERSFKTSDRLGRKIARRGGTKSSGGAALVNMMRGKTVPDTLCGEQAEQAANSLRQAAQRMSGADRDAVLAIAADAEAASNKGGGWHLAGGSGD
ncbi:hypothetical protein ACGFJC_47335 [Nonomuraea fuscirosea]|uniref:DUF7739 domain-containing protein n=1 Tax=Nonomuraea fuscirosea TaxID=1291556 RepID=UPI0037154DDC